MKRYVGLGGTVSLVIGFSFLLIPVLVLIVFSLNESRLISEWGGFSGRWYNALVHDDGFMKAAWNSATVAFISSTIGVGLGTAMGFALAQIKSFRSRVLFSGMIYGPALLPPAIIGLALALLFVGAGIKPGIAAVITAHTFLATCIVAVLVRAQLRLVDPFLKEAAIDLGCTSARYWTQLILPILLPVLVAGWLFAAGLSLGDMVLANYLGDPDAVTLPVKIYSQIRLGPTPMINAASTVLICSVAVLITTALRQLTRSRTLHLPAVD